jgi:hypothetical protein
MIGQHISIVHKGTFAAEPKPLGRGIIRALHYQDGSFALLIEALGAIDAFGINDGALFHLTTSDETVEVIVDREKTDTGGS